MVYKLFDKKTSGGATKNEIMESKELVQGIYKSIIKKFEKRKVDSHFIDHIWSADLVDMQLLSKFNKWIRFLCVIDIYSKYAWVVSLKDEESIKITNAFQKM